MKTNNKIIRLKRFAKSICHCERSAAILFALVLVLSLGVTALPMAGTVEAQTTITMKSGTFNDVSFHKVDSSAVNSYKATVADIITGIHTDDTEFAPEEICIYSNADGYVNGSSMYIPSVLEGLSENDIIKRVTKSYVHDSTTGGSFVNWSTKEEYYKVTDYTHTDTDTILNWLGYGTKNDDGTFTWVLGHGICDDSASVPDRPHLLGLLSQHYETKDVTVYRGATLVEPSTDSRGYIKGTGVSGGDVVATFNYECPILNVVDTITVGATGDYTTIQAAIDAACSDGNTMNVVTGIYGEQLLIDGNDLTIQAASTPVITGVSDAEYIIKVTNADVTLDGLTVDGTGNNIKYGIWYYDNGSGTTSGTITNCTVEYIERAEGKDIRIENSPVDITNNTIKEFAKDGIFVRDSLSTGTISGNEIILRTIDNVNEVQYGVQVGWGADVTIQNNLIYDSTIASIGIYDWNWASSGIFVLDSTAEHGGSGANIINNHIHHCMEGVHIGYQAVSGDTSYGLIQDNNIHDCFWCVGVVGDASADIENNTIKMLDANVIAFVEGYGEGIFVGGGWTGVHEDPIVTITNNTIDNFDMGIDIYENADVTITENDITNCDYGVKTNTADPGYNPGETWVQTVVAYNNNIVGNSECGIDNSGDSATFDATNNWWGAASGPTHSSNPGGTGDAVSGNVNYDPWYIDEEKTTLSNAIATLSDLTLSEGFLSPTFESATTDYTATVINSVNSITVTPTAADTNATIKVNGTSVISGSASASINLIVGTNTITIVVTAQDETTKTYTVTVTRAASSVATLSDLTIDETTISGFDPATLTYNKVLPYGTTVVPTVAATPTDSNNATVDITQATNLTGTEVERTATVVVTAEDGTTTKTYKVIFGSIKVTITKTGPTTANQGNNITYTITYKNEGTFDATNVVVTEAYPSEVSYVSAEPAPDTGNNQWTIGTLAPGAEGTINVNVDIK